MVQTMNPGVIVVGGGLTEWGGAYLERATEVFRRNSSVTLNELPEVRLSELGQDAAVIGATALAFEAGTGNE